MARDPARIKALLARLQNAWEHVPDIRLGQLLIDVCKPGEELFFLEDKELIEKVEDFVFKGI